MPITIEIEVSDDGKLSVGVEQGGGEAPAPAAPGGPPPQQGAAPEEAEDSNMRPVPSIDAALQVARQLLTDAMKQSGAQANSQMDQGFGGKPAPTQMQPGM